MESLLASVHVGNLQRFCQLCCKSKFRLHFLQGRWGGGYFCSVIFYFPGLTGPPHNILQIFEKWQTMSLSFPLPANLSKKFYPKRIYIYFFSFSFTTYGIQYQKFLENYSLFVRYIVCALCSTKVVLFWYFSQNDDLLWIIPRFWNTWGDGWDLEKCNHSFLF